MDKLFKFFSTRELAVLIWLSIGISAMFLSRNMRNGLLSILKLIFGKKIGAVLLFLAIYVSILIWAFYKLNIWNFSLLKDTIFWFCTTALVLFFTINKAKTDTYFRKIIKGNLKWAMVVEFVVNFYTFRLITELILVPFIIFLIALQAYSETDKKYIQVSQFLKNIIALISLTLLIYVVFKTISDFRGLFTLHNLIAFLLPPILTIFLLPFLYLVAIYMNYGELFVRIEILTNDKFKRRELKAAILKVANINLNKVMIIRKNLNKFDWYNSDNVESYIQDLIMKPQTITDY